MQPKKLEKVFKVIYLDRNIKFYPLGYGKKNMKK